MICSSTGLALIPPTTDPCVRISRNSYPPLEAIYRGRQEEAINYASYHRFDTIGGRTLYLSASTQTAFAEVLAPLRVQISKLGGLAKDAHSLGLTTEEFLELIQKEWLAQGHMATGLVPVSWREERQLHLVAPPIRGYWIDIESPYSISAISTLLQSPKNSWVASELGKLGVNELDTGLLRGPNREATVILSSLLRTTTLQGGNPPLGLAYESKHGLGRCFATYYDHHRDIKGAEGEYPTIISSQHIPQFHPDLGAVAKLFDLRVL